jgi:hypothetical protein
MKRKTKPGPRFTRSGLYVEGLHFPATDPGMEAASALAARYVRRYGRPVSIMACLIPGAAMQSFLYVPGDSADASVARRDAHGYVITCAGQTTMGAR